MLLTSNRLISGILYFRAYLVTEGLVLDVPCKLVFLKSLTVTWKPREENAAGVYTKEHQAHLILLYAFDFDLL